MNDERQENFKQFDERQKADKEKKADNIRLYNDSQRNQGGQSKEYQDSLNKDRRPTAPKSGAENKNPAPSKNKISDLKNKISGAKKAAVGIVKNPLWILPFALGIACDILDVPVIATWPIPFLIRPFIAIFLLFQSAPWGSKVKWVGILFLDSAPVIGFIPGTTYCVYDAFTIAQEKKG